ncbi:hypothetical protein TNCV_906631 [Trichonephila clavipes]|nr:hypothetical protein TNCV_906631 [Trichonephila clavipes]
MSDDRTPNKHRDYIHLASNPSPFITVTIPTRGRIRTPTTFSDRNKSMNTVLICKAPCILPILYCLPSFLTGKISSHAECEGPVMTSDELGRIPRW